MSNAPPQDHVPSLPTPSDFAGKLALVTGGTHGLGEHLCRTLVGLGCDVFFCGRDGEKGQSLQQQWGVQAHFVRCQLEDVDQARAFVHQAGRFAGPRGGGRIDYLVNNAAIDPDVLFEKAKVEDFDRVVAIDLRPHFVITHAALPYLKAGEGKAVVNICTTNYLHGWPGATVYNAAKSGIIGFSRSLARELGPAGIRVNVVSPGWIMTERQLREKVSPADQRDLVASQCVQELLTEQHVTPATLFLLSKAAAGIAGQNLVVDGGKYMQ